MTISELMQPMSVQCVFKLEIRTVCCVSMLLKKVGARAFWYSN